MEHRVCRHRVGWMPCSQQQVVAGQDMCWFCVVRVALVLRSANMLVRDAPELALVQT